MSISQKGIIYRAFNKISGKSYIGKTTRPLELRIREHFAKSKTSDHKFANALKYYPKDSWEWSIITEVSLEKLNEYEIYFIADLDTYNTGLNSHPGGNWVGENNYAYNSSVYELYHPDFGIHSGTKIDWVQKDVAFESLHKLVKGQVSHIRGWVMLENRDTYHIGNKKPFRIRIYNFYHPEKGKFCGTCSEFKKLYEDEDKFNKSEIWALGTGKRKFYKGWTLIEEKRDV